ncbi:MAG: hypothetical protein KAF27_09520 [Porphyrobacter sp.]|nr:hypothetical protein [Porphyrobacter sp.]
MRVARYAIALAAAIHLAAPGALAAQDADYAPPADELAYANIIIDTMFPSDQREQMMVEVGANVARQAADGMMTGPLFQEPGLKAIMDRYIDALPETLRPLFAAHLPKLMEATAVAYTRKFSLEELREISAFAQTPSGKTYFSSVQSLLGDPVVAEANQAMFAAAAPVLQAEQARLRKEIEGYLKANPDALSRLDRASRQTKGK